jgi:hypothetical protein
MPWRASRRGRRGRASSAAASARRAFNGAGGLAQTLSRPSVRSEAVCQLRIAQQRFAYECQDLASGCQRARNGGLDSAVARRGQRYQVQRRSAQRRHAHRWGTRRRRSKVEDRCPRSADRKASRPRRESFPPPRCGASPDRRPTPDTDRVVRDGPVHLASHQPGGAWRSGQPCPRTLGRLATRPAGTADMP